MSTGTGTRRRYPGLGSESHCDCLARKRGYAARRRPSSRASQTPMRFQLAKFRVTIRLAFRSLTRAEGSLMASQSDGSNALSEQSACATRRLRVEGPRYARVYFARQSSLRLASAFGLA